MNNYNFLQQKLHAFALSSHFMREITFEVETSLLKKRPINNNHVFVVGLARSGTTVLLNAIFDSNEFASLSYKDMPFILSPNLWSIISPSQDSFRSFERAHKDGISVSIESPEAFEEVFWKTFDHKDPDTYEKFKVYVDCITQRYSKDRYLSKNNQNLKRLSLLSKIYPKAKILIPFRNPIQHAQSLLTQHKLFIDQSRQDSFIGKYMNWIGHTEFGPNYNPVHSEEIDFLDDMTINHWLEQWVSVYENCINLTSKNDNYTFICYETLCQSEYIWENILDFLEINQKYNFTFVESVKNVSYEADTILKKKSNELYERLRTLSIK